MSSKRTNKSLRGKRMSKMHTKTDNVDGSEVFVLPPQLLQKLGINLNQVHQTGENVLTDVPNVDLQANDRTIKKSLEKCSNNLNENVSTRTESSILETADLMKKSVFLSPTFVPEISTVLINSEVEFSCCHHNENENQELIVKHDSNETELISKEHGRKGKLHGSKSTHENNNRTSIVDFETTNNVFDVNTLLPGTSNTFHTDELSQENSSIIKKRNEDLTQPNKVVKAISVLEDPLTTIVDFETTNNVFDVNTLLPGNSNTFHTDELSQENSSMIRKRNEDLTQPNKVVKAISVLEDPLLSSINEYTSQNNQIITKDTLKNYVSFDMESMEDTSETVIKTNENLLITEVINTEYNVNSKKIKKAVPLDAVQSASTEIIKTTTATLHCTLDNDNNISQPTDTEKISNLASGNFSFNVNENKVDHIDTTFDDHVDEAYLSDSGNSNLGITETNLPIHLQSSAFVDKTDKDSNKKITILSEEALDSSKFDELMKNPLFSPRRENMFPVCVTDIVTLCHKYCPLGVFDNNGINMIDGIENNQINLNVGTDLLQDILQHEIKSNNKDTAEDSFSMVKYIENVTEVHNDIDLMVDNDKNIENVKNIVIEFIDETSIKSIVVDDVISKENHSPANNIPGLEGPIRNQEIITGYEKCSDTDVQLTNSYIFEKNLHNNFFNSVMSESKNMPIQIPSLYESKKDIAANKIYAEITINNAFQKNIETNFFNENNTESISVLKIDNNESVDVDQSNDMKQHGEGVMENGVNTFSLACNKEIESELVFSNNVVVKNLEVPLKLTSNVEITHNDKRSVVKNQHSNDENNQNEISKCASDRISEIASYLEKYAHILINRRKSSSHAERKEKYKIMKNNVLLSELIEDGVEKPGGSSKQNSEHEDHVQNKTFKTYGRSIKMPRPIPIYISPSYTDNNMLYEIPSAAEHRNMMFQSHDNYCLCSDFGSLSFYDTQKVYQHMHFQNNKTSIFNTNIFSMEQDYIKYIENQLDKMELVSNETPDEKCGSICWKTYENADTGCDKLTEYYKWFLKKDTEKDLKSSNYEVVDNDINELSVPEYVDRRSFEKADTLKNIDLHNQTIDLVHIEEKPKNISKEKITNKIDGQKSQKIEINAPMIIKNHKTSTESIMEEITEHLSELLSSAKPNLQMKTDKKNSNCDIKTESLNTDVILPENINKQQIIVSDLSLEPLLGKIRCPQDTCDEKVEKNIGMKDQVYPVIHTASNKDTEYDQLKCGVCKSILGAEQWNDHISKEHCFIAWKDGEFLDLRSDDFINNLNKKVKSDNILKCTFCETRVKNVKRFISHVQKCLENHKTSLEFGTNSAKFKITDVRSYAPGKHDQSQEHIEVYQNSCHTEESKKLNLPSNVPEPTNYTYNVEKGDKIISKLFQKQKKNNAIFLSENCGDAKDFVSQMSSSNNRNIVEKKSASGKSRSVCSGSNNEEKLSKYENLNNSIKNPHTSILEESFDNVPKTCTKSWKAETITKSIDGNNEKASTSNNLEKSCHSNKASVSKGIDSNSDDEPLIKRRRIRKSLDNIEKTKKVISLGKKPLKKQGRPRKSTNIVGDERNIVESAEVHSSEMTFEKQGCSRTSKDTFHDEANIVKSAEVYNSEKTVKKQSRTRKSINIVDDEQNIVKSAEVHSSEMTVGKQGCSRTSKDTFHDEANIVKSAEVYNSEKTVKKQSRARKSTNIVDDKQNILKSPEVHSSEMTVEKQGCSRKSTNIVDDEQNIVKSAEVHSSEMTVNSKDTFHDEANIVKSAEVYNSENTVKKQSRTRKSTNVVEEEQNIVVSADVHSSEMTVEKQRRSRKSKDTFLDKANIIKSAEVYSSEMIVKKQGRPRKIRDISHDKSILNVKPVKKRKSLNNLELKLDEAQGSVIQNSKQSEDSHVKKKKIKKNKKIKEDLNRDQTVECGVCNTQMLAFNWIAHIKKEHNYLAWRTGEPEIDLSDSKEVHTHLLAISSSINGLECAKCGLVRRYPKVFLQHTEKCKGPAFDVNLFSPNSTLDNSKTNTDLSLLSQANDALSSPNKVICAVCSVELSAKSWKDHALNNHYNIAWRVGDIPIDVRNPYTAERCLKAYKSVRKSLVCNVCNASRVSYSGFYAHILTCGKTEEEVEKFKDVCGECNQKYLCIYRQQHLMVHREKELSLERKRLALEQSLLAQQNKKAEETAPSGRRKAAVKAETVIENYTDGNLNYKCENCDFAANNKKDLKRHKCGDRTQNDDGSDVSVAFQSESDSEESAVDSSLSANEEEKEADIQKRKHHKSVRMYGVKMPFKVRDPKSYIQKAGQDFFNYHYTDGTLFDDWKHSECELVLDEELEKYLPSLEESCKVRTESGTEWFTYKRFEAKNDTVTSLFTGGTPQCVSWAPAPSRHKAQDGGDNYLAIACHREGDLPRYACDESYEHPALVQLWDFGLFGKTIPKLVLGLALDNGAIWGFDWCPSGARDLPGQGSRLGLLVVAFSNGMANIYAVPYPATLPNTEKPFYKLKPVAELRLYSKEKLRNIQCTSICWSAQKGHETVIAGYSDGTVAYYSLVFDSPLCCSEENGIAIFYPNHDEKQHNSCVTGISTFASKEPSSNGLVSSASSTAARLGPVRARCSASSAPLAPHWPSALLAGHAAVISELDFFGGSRRLGFSRYITSCLHCGIAAHSNPPLIRKLNAHPIFPEPNKKNLLCVDMKPLSDSLNRKRKVNTQFEMMLEPFTYETAVEKYGLEIIFVTKKDRFGLSNNALEIRPERFPLNDVNSMAFCTNAVHHQKLAVAIHSGIVIVFQVS